MMIEIKGKVGKHKGTSPCNLSPEEFTKRDWLQGLVPQTVLKKCLEEQVTETCPKNFKWFELMRLVTVWSMRLDFEAKMASSCNGTCPLDLLQGLVAGASPLVC